MSRLLVLCGTPCTGKSTLGEWLQRDHGWIFINHDFRRDLSDEPPEETAWWSAIFAGSMDQFIEFVAAGGRDVVVEFGFPIQLLPLVEQLRQSGHAQLFWFQGDRYLARETFFKRNADWAASGLRPPISMAAFDNTIAFQRATWNRIRPLFRHRILVCLSPGSERPTSKELFATIVNTAGWSSDAPGR